MIWSLSDAAGAGCPVPDSAPSAGLISALVDVESGLSASVSTARQISLTDRFKTSTIDIQARSLVSLDVMASATSGNIVSQRSAPVKDDRLRWPVSVLPCRSSVAHVTSPCERQAGARLLSNQRRPQFPHKIPREAPLQPRLRPLLLTWHRATDDA